MMHGAGLYVVTVRFRAKAGDEAAFRTAIIANAKASLADEPGCLVFDVCEDAAGIFLYEIYESRAAFDAHLSSSHYLAFAKDSESMVAEKTVAPMETLFSQAARP